MEKVLAVLTKEKKYAERLCDYVNRKNNYIFTAIPFHSTEDCVEFSQNHKVEILLADSDILGTDSGYGHALRKKPDIKAEKVIRLREGHSFARALADSPAAEGISITKYQSADMLMRELMRHCEDMNLLKTSEAIGRPVRIIGIYSPISRCGKTSFALTLSRVISKTQKTLYMSLEEFSNMEALSGDSYSVCLSDAIYHMKQGSLTPQKIYSMVYTYSGVEYIPPIRYADDRNAVSGEDYVQLISLILKNTAYETIVIDMDRFADEASEIMEICDTVYMPVIENYADRLKVDSFMNYLKSTDRASLIEKIRQIHVPSANANTGQSGISYLDNLLYGGMGDMVRELREA